MNPARRKLLSAGFAVGAAACAPGIGWANKSELLRLVVPFAPGGGGDVLGRLMADKLSAVMGDTIIVENKPGASAVLATDYVAKSAPDGRTILLTIPLLVQTPFLMPKLPYDPITDLVPVIDLVKSPLWLAVSTRNTTATNIQDFIADVHANPTKHAFGSLGNGSTSHILGERINEITKSRMLHVPYKGSAAVTLALMNGEISLAILDLVTLQPQLQSGKIRLIGVTGDVRSPLTPEVATLKEQGLNGFENLTWAGLFYPAKTPDKTIERLHDAALKVLGDPAIQDRLKGLGYLPGGNSQKSFAESVAKERAYWKEMIAKTHVTAN